MTFFERHFQFDEAARTSHLIEADPSLAAKVNVAALAHHPPSDQGDAQGEPEPVGLVRAENLVIS
jgi:hypothetical protein